jgi:hypothetical protein
MHSVYARISNVSAFMSSCLMTLLAAVALSSFIFTADPKGDLLVSSVKVSVALPSCAVSWTLLRSYFLMNDRNVLAMSILRVFDFAHLVKVSLTAAVWQLMAVVSFGCQFCWTRQALPSSNSTICICEFQYQRRYVISTSLPLLNVCSDRLLYFLATFLIRFSITNCPRSLTFCDHVFSKT